MNSTNAGPIITVSAQTVATVSDRVPLESQNVYFRHNPVNNQITVISRANMEDNMSSSKKGLQLVFNRDIKSGTYSVNDANFPFHQVYYYETGAIPNGVSKQYDYNAKSGTLTVEAIEASDDKVHYKIGFDFRGVDQRSQELTISGKSTYIAFMQST